MIASGRLLQGILARRIVWKQATFTGSPERIIRRIVTQAAISPEEPGRVIPGLVLAPEINAGGSMKIQFTGDNVAEAIEGICRTSGLGFTVDLDRENAQFSFRLYKGADRSYNQNTNPYIVFSNDFENLLSTEYTNDTTEAANVAQVAGEGEGTARKKATVGTASGINRYEIWVDERNTSSNEGEISPSEYQELLEQAGAEKLAETGITTEFTGEVLPDVNFVYGVDYFLGDIVQIENDYGISKPARITEIIESEDENGPTVIPTFEEGGN